MDLVDKRVAEKFAAFEQEQDLALVYQALDAVEAAERDASPNDTEARRRAVSRWLRFMAMLERVIDPKWDAKNVPVCGAPPPPMDCAVDSSGEVDPATIPDRAMRAGYEQALKASKDYEKWYGGQFQLRRVDERAMRFVEWLLAERYTNSEQNRQELEELLATSPVADTRKERLRIYLPEPQ
jgi:hypothetical protein